MTRAMIPALLLALAALAATPGHAQARANGMSAQHERYCSDKRAALDIDKVAKGMNLTDPQKAAFKEYEDTRLKAEADMKVTICSNQPDFSTFKGRLAAQQVFLEAHLAALKSQIPKLIAFYDTLDAKQKAMFDETTGRRQRHR